MTDLVNREISWRAVTRVLRRRQLSALSVSTTEVATGRTVVFMQVAPDIVIPATAPPRTLFRADHIGPNHALASAAIPLLFPPVKIGQELYLDGGLRQNTPIAPALRLGASHIFTIGSSREVKGVRVNEGTPKIQRAPGAAFLLGKVLNAFLLDHVDIDLELLGRLNKVIDDGTRHFGDDFVQEMSKEAHRRGAPAYRFVHNLTIRPSEDIGRLASDHVRRGRFRGDPLVVKRLFNLLDLGVGDEADLASYLLFDGTFCKQLIEMGRSDAKARRDDLLAFFGDKKDDGGDLMTGDEAHSGTWSGSMIPIPPVNIGT
jgi:NTE family protein